MRRCGKKWRSCSLLLMHLRWPVLVHVCPPLSLLTEQARGYYRKGNIMSKYWQEAQELARKQDGTNFVFLPENRAMLAGYKKRGWRILTAQGGVEVKTARGVDLMLKELDLPLLGWE